MKQYQEALDFIHSRKKFSGALSLDRIRALMEQLGDPQRALPCIHIAGTNGKGSTATMIATVLKKAGYKTGLFTSPFIHDFRERFMINGELIPKERLTALTAEVKNTCESLEAAGKEAANEFEIVAAIGFLYFCRENCDIAVIETGLGGRFDATNIIEKPLASVICSISMDHTAILGDTIEKIAFEKAGIIKEHCPAILYHRNPTKATGVLKEACNEKNAPFFMAEAASLKVLDEKENSFTYKGAAYALSLQGP
ncbi:MAG: bifunctional folylpolyglutamate synthase/dihydrofolate synthase, partial [Clostridia bacterium]|nr:bifunctional folylpolyglutamate synthase/dihydrofolate synthase [Clostridia bacterium]